MYHRSAMRALLCVMMLQAALANPIAPLITASQIESLFQHERSKGSDSLSNAAAPRRMYASYPSTLLQKPEDCSGVDVLVGMQTHMQCQWAFNENTPDPALAAFRYIINASGAFPENVPKSFTAPAIGHVAINVTIHSLQSVITQVFPDTKEVHTTVVYASGSQATYISHVVSRSFACAAKSATSYHFRRGPDCD